MLAGPEALEPALGVTVHPDLLLRALTHRSYAYENGGLPTNERLEFLGDSVLGLVVTDALYRTPPRPARGPAGQAAGRGGQHARAGRRRPRRSASATHLLLGRGEETTGGRDKASILADTIEAVIGAVYLSAAWTRRATLVHRLFDPLIAQSATLGAGLDWKTSLQELTAALGLGVPEYLVDESGPDHAEGLHAPAVASAPTCSATGPAAARRRPSSRPPRPPGAQRRRRAAAAPATGPES